MMVRPGNAVAPSFVAPEVNAFRELDGSQLVQRTGIGDGCRAVQVLLAAQRGRHSGACRGLDDGPEVSHPEPDQTGVPVSLGSVEDEVVNGVDGEHVQHYE